MTPHFCVREFVVVDSPSNRCKDRHHSASATHKRNAFLEERSLLARKRSFYALIEQFWFVLGGQIGYHCSHVPHSEFLSPKLKPD